ncbi:MAG: stage II sporulation protein M [Acidimicrobiales bacterium]
MNADRFVQERGPAWAELEDLLRRGQVRTAKLDPAELLRLGALYRTAAADLALANRLWPSAAGTVRLQDLVIRANGTLYSKAGRQETAWQYLSSGMWQRLRSLGPCLAISAAFLFGAVLLGAIWAIAQPVAAAGILPAGFHVSAHNRGGYYGVAIAGRAGLAVSIFVNNIEVTALAIAGGLSAGVLTAFSLAYNGALIGVLGGLEWRVGGLGGFLSLIVPHGLLELSCITVAGAAGFAIARALVDPGVATRSEGLSRLRPTLATAMLADIIFLVVAGTTEGVITPFDLPTVWAFAVGVPLAGFFWAMVFWRGRPGSFLPPSKAGAGLEPEVSLHAGGT